MPNALHALNADLHSHSTVSDGALSPRDLVLRARRQCVDLFALTDHDTVDGLAQAQQTAAAIGQKFVAGVEISVTWAGQTVHVLGLGIDPTDATLCDGLAGVRAGRLDRAREMGQKLAAVGVAGAFDGALALAGNPDLLSRTHFARYLVLTGHCSNVREVFRRYLIDGLPGYVPHRWATLTDAMRWIRVAGGTAVLAHPGRYKYDETQLHALLTEFKQSGGEGIEIATSNHGLHEANRFARLAQEFGFEASRGSDFHSPTDADIELGRVDRVPAALLPVWHRFA
ncbi:MAG: 3',5'-nucleoside bisphosphate phosphatase [Gemmatimonadota bacterium]